MYIDLTKGFGTFPTHTLAQFPDNSIKFTLNQGTETDKFIVDTTFRSSDDILTIGLVAQVIKNMYPLCEITCNIHYMMYQQDDRQFAKNESFGLKLICNILNSYEIDRYTVFHPHSDKVEFVNGIQCIDNYEFITDAYTNIQMTNSTLKPLAWVIPDSGAFKTQFKQIEKRGHRDFITCMKSRNHTTGEIITVVNVPDLQGQDCFIVDDICLGGNTFINIAKELKAKNCGRLYLMVSHGVFNKGVDHLYEYFECIYTTDSICGLLPTDKLKIFNL